MYAYMTLADGTEIVHSQLIEPREDEVGGYKKVVVHFEKAVDEGFLEARCELPTYKWLYRRGFCDEQIAFFVKLLESNAHLLYKYAAEGGIHIA